MKTGCSGGIVRVIVLGWLVIFSQAAALAADTDEPVPVKRLRPNLPKIMDGKPGEQRTKEIQELKESLYGRLPHQLKSPKKPPRGKSIPIETQTEGESESKSIPPSIPVAPPQPPVKKSTKNASIETKVQTQLGGGLAEASLERSPEAQTLETLARLQQMLKSESSCAPSPDSELGKILQQARLIVEAADSVGRDPFTITVQQHKRISEELDRFVEDRLRPARVKIEGSHSSETAIEMQKVLQESVETELSRLKADLAKWKKTDAARNEVDLRLHMDTFIKKLLEDSSSQHEEKMLSQAKSKKIDQINAVLDHEGKKLAKLMSDPDLAKGHQERLEEEKRGLFSKLVKELDEAKSHDHFLKEDEIKERIAAEYEKLGKKFQAEIIARKDAAVQIQSRFRGSNERKNLMSQEKSTQNTIQDQLNARADENYHEIEEQVRKYGMEAALAPSLAKYREGLTSSARVSEKLVEKVGAGKSATIHEMKRTKALQSEAQNAHNEMQKLKLEISNEVHQKHQAKISGGIQRFSNETLLGYPYVDQNEQTMKLAIDRDPAKKEKFLETVHQTLLSQYHKTECGTNPDQMQDGKHIIKAEQGKTGVSFYKYCNGDKEYLVPTRMSVSSKGKGNAEVVKSQKMIVGSPATMKVLYHALDMATGESKVLLGLKNAGELQSDLDPKQGQSNAFSKIDEQRDAELRLKKHVKALGIDQPATVFDREGTGSISSLKSGNSGPVSDSGHSGEKKTSYVYTVEPYGGLDLKTRMLQVHSSDPQLQKQGNVLDSSAKVVNCSKQILGQVARMHQKGIYHRDIKPANILVADQGDCKVIDWGSSVWVEESPEGKKVIFNGYNHTQDYLGWFPKRDAKSTNDSGFKSFQKFEEKVMSEGGLKLVESGDQNIQIKKKYREFLISENKNMKPEEIEKLVNNSDKFIGKHNDYYQSGVVITQLLGNYWGVKKSEQNLFLKDLKSKLPLRDGISPTMTDEFIDGWFKKHLSDEGGAKKTSKEIEELKKAAKQLLKSSYGRNNNFEETARTLERYQNHY